MIYPNKTNYVRLIILTLIILMIISGYFIGRLLVAEIYFRKSIEAIVQNNSKDLYNYQKKAIELNPYVEKYRINFSRTNLIIANNLASKQADKITHQDKQMITLAIQTAITEAKAAISLNPNKASNWENLAFIYKNIINTVENADIWAISAYLRAIVLEPQNPNYPLNLGGVYYKLNKYNEAINYFQQAVNLKPDWANAYYNLAWAAYKNKNYERAINAMNNVIQIETKNNSKQYLEKAKNELTLFKQH